jgi:hypothetical protein
MYPRVMDTFEAQSVVFTESEETESEALERIESAIEQKVEPELQWALLYCATKVRNTTRKDRLKYWHRLGQSVRGVLADLEKPDEPKS